MTQGEIQKLRDKGMTYQAIADSFGVSRQRIHQIYKHYTTLGTKLKRIRKILGDGCAKCSEPAKATHHIDGDSYNNKITNLMPLCLKHHIQMHKETAVKKLLTCIECGSVVLVDPTKKKTKYCNLCLRYFAHIRFNPPTKKTLRRHERLKECAVCDKPFTKENPYKMNNMHKRCAEIARYYTDPKYLITLRKGQKKYVATHREEIRKRQNEYFKHRRVTDPAFREYMNTRTKNYYAKNKDYRNEYRKQYRIKLLLDN